MFIIYVFAAYEQIVYMDHLEFGPNSHVINYSIPRVCHVTSKDFKFAAQVDLDRKILNNKYIFGRRPVQILFLCISFVFLCAHFYFMHVLMFLFI
jgi:hypothetical protein